MNKTETQQVLDALKLLDPTLLFTDWENGDGEEIHEQLRAAAALCEASLARVVEPVAQVADDFIFFLRKQPNGERWPKGMNLYAAEQPSQSQFNEHDLDQALRERDYYHDMADKLSQGIAEHFDGDIGEHSNINSPWQRALDLLDSAACAETMRLTSQSISSEAIDRLLVAADDWSKHVDYDHVFGRLRDHMLAEIAAINATPQEAAAQPSQAAEPKCAKCGELVDDIANCNRNACPTMAQFNAWWNGSKYMQVVNSSSGTRQAALDGWNAAINAKVST